MFQKLLVLDLDETLVYATKLALDYPPNCTVGPYHVYHRPGVEQFMAWAFANFTGVAIWTVSTASYAHPVLQQLLGQSYGQLALVWTRRRCTLRLDPHTREYEYIKDLKKLRRRGFRRERVLAVDNTPSKWCRSYGNLIAVSDFEGDRNDHELTYLQRYLAQIGDRNPRTIEKRGWRKAFANQ